MRILLTGASGMVGKNIREHLLAKNFDFLTPTSSEVNLLNKESVVQFIELNKPDLIIHAAGRVGGIHANMADPISFLVENTLMGLHVINGAYQSGVKYCINLGSSCMYPRNVQNPLKEEQILTGDLEPTNEGYALAKITAARLCEYVQKTDADKRYITLIPCNLYGRHDKFDPQLSHMIPAVIRKIYEAVENETPSVEIWGDGEARREFMYVEDLADCIYAVIDKMCTGAVMPSLMNVGMGRDYTINEYYCAVANIIGYKGTFTHDLTKPVGMRQKLVDSSRINAVGWKSNTSLLNGIEKTYKYFLKEIINV